MQEWTLQTLVPKASKAPFYLSVVFFIAIFLVTLWLLISNWLISSKIESLSQTMALRRGEISEISKDRNVIVMKILNSNTIPPMMNLKWILANFRDVAANSNVRLKWFSIRQNVISTSLIATDWVELIHPDPASTIVSMMRAYNNAQGDGTFTLEPILWISWWANSRTTSVQLKVLPTISK